MKIFSTTSLLITGALVASMTGCASTASNPARTSGPAMSMGAGDKMDKGGCACCGMQKEGASHDMKQKPMGMMQDMAGSGQAGMCMPGMDDQKKGGCSCCEMQKMDKSGCACCGTGNKEMSSDMHQKHMGMHHKNVPAQTTAN